MSSSNLPESDPTRLTEEGVVLNPPNTYQGALERCVIGYHDALTSCDATLTKNRFGEAEVAKMSVEQRKQLYHWSKPGPIPGVGIPYPPHLSALDEVEQPFDAESLLTTQMMVGGVLTAEILDLAPDLNDKTMSHLEERNARLREAHGGKTLNMYRNGNIGDRSDWYTDAVFAQQQFTGVNPTTLTIASKAWVDSFIAAAAKTDQAALLRDLLYFRASTKSLYVQDYSYLRQAAGLEEGAEMKNGEKYLGAPVALFNLKDSGALDPLAIIIDWKGTLEKSVVIFNPHLKGADKPAGRCYHWPWRFAKTCVAAADWTRHEITVHLVNTHLLEEAIIVAAHRAFDDNHPVFQLLQPHWAFTLSVNHLARTVLVPGVIARLAGMPATALVPFLNRAYYTFDFTGQYVPNDLKKRGFPTDPKVLSEPKYHNYGYARNIVRTWEVLRKFVGTVLKATYSKDEDVVQDSLIQNFCDEMRSDNKGNLKSFPAVKTVEELIDMVTMCIHIASFQHSAVNYLQEYYQVFVPNKPPAIYAKLPETLDQLSRYKEADLIDALPYDEHRDWLISAQLPYLLSFQVVPDQSIIMYAYKESHPHNPNTVIRDAATTFRTDLDVLDKEFQGISAELDDQNKEERRAYNVLDPDLTASSILI